jgi:hypothetical protein
VLRAVVGAAFSCLQAVMSQASGEEDAAEVGRRLDIVMDRVRPVRYA